MGNILDAKLADIPTRRANKSEWKRVAEMCLSNLGRAVLVSNADGRSKEKIRMTGCAAIRRYFDGNKFKIRSSSDAEGCLFWLEEKHQ